MFQIPSEADHLAVVIQLTREGKDLSLYCSAMNHYRTSLQCALSSYNLAMDNLMELATESESRATDEGVSDEF